MISEDVKIIGNILENGEIERANIGEGSVYWNKENFGAKKGICYVSEIHDMKYTYEDFINLTNSEEVAKTLFESLTWQSPETLLEEYIDLGEVTFCTKCKKSYLSYDVYVCPYCNNINIENYNF